jgi:phytanoyl-CoA hydroxylase
MTEVRLSEEMIQEFYKNGFIIVRKILSPDEVKPLVVDYEKAISGEIKIPVFGDDHVKGRMVQLANPSKHIPGWQEHVYFQRSLAIARQLISEDANYIYDQIIMKPPHHPAETPWHQDAGYWKNSKGSDQAVTCWLALSTVWKENGGMQFIPGSHLSEIQEHYKVSDRSEINQALETKVDATQALAVSLEPGDATFHHARTLHYTSGNSTDVPRYGLITHFWAR